MPLHRRWTSPTLTRILLVGLCLAGSPAWAQAYSQKVGVITSLTGADQAFGTQQERGYTLALEEINASGGVLGKRLELVKYDDQSQAWSPFGSRHTHS